MLIMLDLDGVLCDFEGAFKQHIGLDYHVRLSEEQFNANWYSFISNEHFKNLEYHPGAEKLIDFVKSLNGVNIEILSSLGGEKYAQQVETQKREWLFKNGIWFKQNFVVDRNHKQHYVRDRFSVLIDDHPENIEQWNKAGGIGILHTDIEDTCAILDMHHKMWQKHVDVL